MTSTKKFIEDAIAGGWKSYENDFRFQMHRFIDHLADGKSIDEALKAIE